jgi:hypothetical protein
METSYFRVSFRPSVAYCQRLDRLSDFYKIVQESSSCRYVADAIVLICNKPTGVTGERDFLTDSYMSRHHQAVRKKKLNLKHKIYSKMRSQTSFPVHAACCVLSPYPWYSLMLTCVYCRNM